MVARSGAPRYEATTKSITDAWWQLEGYRAMGLVSDLKKVYVLRSEGDYDCKD